MIDIVFIIVNLFRVFYFNLLYYIVMVMFDSVTLKSWLAENEEFLIGARIQKIQQPTRREFLLTFRNRGDVRKLYININPQFFHLCFVSKENEKKRFIEIPSKPPMFCMLLRKYLENSLVAKVVQPEYERILEFYIETYNELSEKIYLCLAIELMGKHSNVILYNHDTNLILGCAHNVGAEKSREREMAGGLPYVYPKRQNDFWYVSADSISNIKGEVNSNIDNYFANLICTDKFIKLKDSYAHSVEKHLKKVCNSLDKLLKQFVISNDYDKFRLYADLIIANIYDNTDFSKEICVYDYENNKQISIPLDAALTLKENAVKYYNMYNKTKVSSKKQAEQIDRLNQEKIYLEQLLYSINNAVNMDDLNFISQEIEPDKKQLKTVKTLNLPKEIKGENYVIYIGRNNKQNDYIVSKLSKSDDLWFHTRDCAGSHVLLRSDIKDEKLISMCAKLAKEYSLGVDSSKVGVIYTFAKYLKKPPKSKLGYVTYSHEKEIIV